MVREQEETTKVTKGEPRGPRLWGCAENGHSGQGGGQVQADSTGRLYALLQGLRVREG